MLPVRWIIWTSLIRTPVTLAVTAVEAVAPVLQDLHFMTVMMRVRRMGASKLSM